MALFNYAVRLGETFAVPPEYLWRALTDADLLSQWLMPNDFVPEVGHRFVFRAPPRLGWKGVILCKVLEIEPGRRLSYSWIGNDDMPQTVVTWRLEPADAGTRAIFDHSGFSGIKYCIIGRFLRLGWKRMISQELPKVLAASNSQPARSDRAA